MPAEHSLWGRLANGFTLLPTVIKYYKTATKLLPCKQLFKKDPYIKQLQFMCFSSNHKAGDLLRTIRNNFFGIMLNTKIEMFSLLPNSLSDNKLQFLWGKGRGKKGQGHLRQQVREAGGSRSVEMGSHSIKLYHLHLQTGIKTSVRPKGSPRQC